MLTVGWKHIIRVLQMRSFWILRGDFMALSLYGYRQCLNLTICQVKKKINSYFSPFPLTFSCAWCLQQWFIVGLFKKYIFPRKLTVILIRGLKIYLKFSFVNSNKRLKFKITFFQNLKLMYYIFFFYILLST